MSSPTPALVHAPLISFDLGELNALLTGLPGDFPAPLYRSLEQLHARLGDYHRVAGTLVSLEELTAIYEAIVTPLDEVEAQARARVLSESMEHWCHEVNRQMTPLREAITGEPADNLAFDDDVSWDA
ncbi:hypothetical protein RKE25_11910 [Dyella sp. BiH032]|uniref:hypothetical protein n=1 Tax=Dyella sp. BiH032 TaxID=3075430 RepID=UPI00289376FD|nr:hypothetical protein [Dyella sp. BiH032]WNL44135.1 hypothetical protein RKE25_11910 [Dyella sp. BiH032]